jgi:catechol 2,3-dioxygenase
VANIPGAVAFYAGVFGFVVMAHFGESAAFLAGGGYHNNLGINTWGGDGVPLPPVVAWRLLWYEIKTADLTAVKQRLEKSETPFSLVGNTIHVADPSGNQIHIVAPN